MAIGQRIGVIGGNGWLGTALLQPAIAKGIVDPHKLILSCRSGNKGALADCGALWTGDNAELAEKSDVIVLSVRPFQFRDVKADMAGKLVISVMAGITCEGIARHTNATRIVRSIPNAAAGIGESFTPWFATADVSAGDKALVRALFQASGEAAEVTDESHVAYCAGFTGPGAAFPALLAEAMIAHAVSKGIPPELARTAARHVVSRASQLFAGPQGDTARIVQEMVDYKGVVAAAIETMVDRGFKTSVAAGLDAAAAKASSIASL